jgi:phage terminase large subunit
MSKEVVLNHKYGPLFDEQDKNRYFICTGGRGSGKSFSITIFLVNLTFEYGQKILFTRYTLTSAKTSIIPQFIECLESLGYGNETFEITNDTITNKVTGSQILFKGIKTSSGVQTASLKSLTGITAFVVDEAEELTDEEVFNKIDYSVRVKGVHNRVILIMNPATVDHWIYKRWFTQTQDNTTYIHTTYLDNIDNLNEDIIHKFNTLKESNPKEYEHVVLGGWKLKADGVIFENWTKGTFDESLPFIYGADYGFTNDPSTLIKVAVDEKKKTIYIQECMYEKHLSTEQLKTLYKSIVGSSVVVCDSAEPRLINDLKMSGINALPCVKKGGSVLSGIQDLLGYKMIVCGHSPNLVTELNNYEWIDRGSKTIPIDDHNHLIDPIRYAKFKLINSFFVL